MSAHPLGRRVLAEFLGTGLLVAVAVGSAIAAGRLSPDPGVQLLASALATAMGLGVLIVLLAPVSGAHLNPVVSLALTALEGRSPNGMLKRGRPRRGRLSSCDRHLLGFHADRV